MSAHPSQPIFRRLFPPHHWRERRGLSLILWSVIAAGCLMAGLLLAASLVDLLVHRGEVQIPAEQVESLRPLLADTRFALAQPEGTSGSVALSDSGLLPTVLRGESRWWGGPLRSLWRRLPWLQYNNGALGTLLLGLFALGVLRVLAVSATRISAARLAMESNTALRRAIHRQALRLGPSDLDGAEQRAAIDLFTHTTTDARRALADWLQGLIRRPLELASLITLLLATDWRLGLQCLLPLLLIGWVYREERRKGVEIRRRSDAEADSELRPLADGLRKTRLVRAYGMEEFEHAQFQTHLERYTSKMLTGRMGETWALRSARLFGVVLLVLIAFLIASRVEHGTLAVAGAALMAACLAGLVRLAEQCWSLGQSKQQAEVAAGSVYRYLAQVPEVGQAVGAKFLNPVAQSIILEAVTYRRDGQTLLERVDLRVPAKSTVALVSNEPLSPRAIAFMLPRFIEPHSGRILFDSEDIVWATLESLRAETVYVSADDPFFTGTVMENLICGESRFTAQEAMEASKLAHAHKFITSLPNGYETQLGEHGEQLTPGQSFRLGLARAVLRNPAVLIIEEPQTRMDDDSKALVDDAYARILKDRTVFFLPTRLSTVKLCQQVVFLTDGQVEAVGAHADLVRKSEGFRHWEYVNFSQLSRGKN